MSHEFPPPSPRRKDQLPSPKAPQHKRSVSDLDTWGLFDPPLPVPVFDPPLPVPHGIEKKSMFFQSEGSNDEEQSDINKNFPGPTGGVNSYFDASTEEYRFHLYQETKAFGMVSYQKTLFCELKESEKQRKSPNSSTKEEWALFLYKSMHPDAPLLGRIPLSHLLLRRNFPGLGDVQLLHTLRRHRPFLIPADSEFSATVGRLLDRLCDMKVLYDATPHGAGKGTPRAMSAPRGTSGKNQLFSVSRDLSEKLSSVASPVAGHFFERNKPVTTPAVHQLLMRAHALLWNFETDRAEKVLSLVLQQCSEAETQVAEAWMSYLRAESWFLQCFMSGDVRALASTQEMLDQTLALVGVVFESSRHSQTAKKRARTRITQISGSVMAPSSAPQVADQFLLIHAHATCLKVMLLMWMNKPMKAVWLGKSLVKKVVNLAHDSVQIGPILEFPQKKMQAKWEEMQEPKLEMQAVAYAGTCWHGVAHHVRFLSGLLHCALSTLPDAANQMLGRYIGISSDFVFGQGLLCQAARESGMMRPMAGIFLNVFHHIQSISPPNKKPFPTGMEWQEAAEQVFACPPLKGLPIQRFLKAKALYQKNNLPKSSEIFMDLWESTRRSPFPLHTLIYYSAVSFTVAEQWTKASELFSNLVITLEPFSEEMQYIRLSAAAHAAGLEPYDCNDMKKTWMETALQNISGSSEDYLVAQRMRSYLSRGDHGLDLWLFELFYLVHPSQMKSLPREWHLKLLVVLERGPTCTNAIRQERLDTLEEIDALALHLYLRATILYYAEEVDEACKIFGSFVTRPPHRQQLPWSFFVVQNSFYYFALLRYKKKPTFTTLMDCTNMLQKGLLITPEVYACTNKIKNLLSEFTKLNPNASVL